MVCAFDFRVRKPWNLRLADQTYFRHLYFWGMTTLVLSIVRYMFPVMGLLFILMPGILIKKLPLLEGVSDHSIGTCSTVS